jgi:hypothetical protein
MKGNGTVAMHAGEATRMATVATDAADAAAKADSDNTAAAAASAASAHAAAATANIAAHGSSAGRKAKAATTISPKLWAGTIAGAIAFSFWTIAAATFWKNTFSTEALAALIASTTAILSAAVAYFKADPLRS